MSIDEEKRAAGAPSHAGPATDTSSAAAAGSATAAGGPAPKKRPKRGWIVAGVVAAVIVVAGAGFWVWHEQPSFCNAICHSPMDYYVETYDSPIWRTTPATGYVPSSFMRKRWGT